MVIVDVGGGKDWTIAAMMPTLQSLIFVSGYVVIALEL